MNRTHCDYHNLFPILKIIPSGYLLKKAKKIVLSVKKTRKFLQGDVQRKLPLHCWTEMPTSVT